MDKNTANGEVIRRTERKEGRLGRCPSGLLSHSSGTGVLHLADRPPKESPHPFIKPPFFSEYSRLSSTKEVDSLGSELTASELCIPTKGTR